MHSILESEHCVYTSQPFNHSADHTSVSTLSTAAIISIAVLGTVLLVVLPLWPVTILLVRKHSHSNQTTGEFYETPDICMKENGTNAHIATTANEAYGCVGDIPVAENVAYMPVAENVPTVQNKVYGSVSGAAVNTDTMEQVNVDDMHVYDVVKNN